MDRLLFHLARPRSITAFQASQILNYPRIGPVFLDPGVSLTIGLCPWAYLMSCFCQNSYGFPLAGANRLTQPFITRMLITLMDSTIWFLLYLGLYHWTRRASRVGKKQRKLRQAGDLKATKCVSCLPKLLGLPAQEIRSIMDFLDV